MCAHLSTVRRPSVTSFLTPPARLPTRESLRGRAPFPALAVYAACRQTGQPCRPMLPLLLGLPVRAIRIHLGPPLHISRPHGCLLEHPSLAYNKSFTSVSFVVTARCLCCHDAGRHSCCPDWAGSWATHSDVSIEFNKAGCWLRSTAEKGPSCKSHRRLLLLFDDPVGSQSRQRHVPLCPRLAGMACCHDTMPPVARLARTLLLLQAVGGLCLPRTSDEHLDTPAALTAPSETVAFAPALILLPPFPTWPLSRSRCIDTKQVAISSKKPLPDSAVLSKSRCLGCRA